MFLHKMNVNCYCKRKKCTFVPSQPRSKKTHEKMINLLIENIEYHINIIFAFNRKSDNKSIYLKWVKRKK